MESIKVQEALYNFTQRCFIGDVPDKKIDLSYQEEFFDILKNCEELSVVRVHQLKDQHKALLRELLIQYTTFITLFNHLKFPPEFLEGSSDMKLGKNVLSYFCENKWPFPQSLEKKTH
jgi:hypothetical protein